MKCIDPRSQELGTAIGDSVAQAIAAARQEGVEWERARVLGLVVTYDARDAVGTEYRFVDLIADIREGAEP